MAWESAQGEWHGNQPRVSDMGMSPCSVKNKRACRGLELRCVHVHVYSLEYMHVYKSVVQPWMMSLFLSGK